MSRVIRSPVITAVVSGTTPPPGGKKAPNWLLFLYDRAVKMNRKALKQAIESYAKTRGFDLTVR